MTKQSYETEFLNPNELTDGHEIMFKQPRQTYEKGKIRELADSIAKMGLINPLQVWITKDQGVTHKIRIGGGRRMEAIKLLIEEGRTKEGPAKDYDKAVPCHIVNDKDAKDAFATAVADNLNREEMTTFEQSESVWHMATTHGMTGMDIAEKLSKSNAWVSRMISCYREATPNTREAWRKGKITQESVRDLISAHKHDPLGMDKAVEKLVEVREPDDKQSRGKGRGVAKNKKNTKPGKNSLEFMKVKTEEAPMKYKYVRGIHDGIMFAMGLMGSGDFEDDYEEYVQWRNEKEKEAEEKEKAKLREATP